MQWVKERVVPGATVAMSYGIRGDRYSLHTIERVTKTQVVLSGSSERLNLSNGRVIGYDGWSARDGYTPTEEEVQAILDERERVRNAAILSDARWGTFDLAFLREMVSALAKKQAED